MKYIVTINDKSYEIEVEKGVAEVLNVKAAEQTTAQVQNPPEPQKSAPEAAPAPAPQAPTAVTAQHTSASGELILSPMPGVIVSVVKSVGDKVKKGDTLVVLEAMKMENEITSTVDGEVSQILTSKGAAVNSGDPLVVIS